MGGASLLGCGAVQFTRVEHADMKNASSVTEASWEAHNFQDGGDSNWARPYKSGRCEEYRSEWPWAFRPTGGLVLRGLQIRMYLPHHAAQDAVFEKIETAPLRQGRRKIVAFGRVRARIAPRHCLWLERKEPAMPPLSTSLFGSGSR